MSVLRRYSICNNHRLNLLISSRRNLVAAFATDRQIDKLVYALSGLMEEEMGIVEGNA